MENKAKEKGLLEEAQNKAQETIKTFVESCMYSSDDEYKIEIKWQNLKMFCFFC